MKDIVVAQFGCGYWGPNLLRNLRHAPGCRVKWVADPEPSRRAYVAEVDAHIRTVAEIAPVLDDPEVAAVVLSTPVATHFEIAEKVLAAGKHVLIEKPVVTSLADLSKLARLAEARNLVMMAGHTFLYNEAVHYLRGMLDAGDLGDLYYAYSQRLNLGRVRDDVDAWWNFAPHDVSILVYLRGNTPPETVHLSGVDYLQPGIADVVFANLTWADRVSANLHLSWLDPGKTRKLTLVGSRKMATYDDTKNEKIAIYDKGMEKNEWTEFDHPPGLGYAVRHGDVFMPYIKWVEPLKAEVGHFLDCVRNGIPCLTGIEHATSVTAVIVAGERSLATGEVVKVRDVLNEITP